MIGLVYAHTVASRVAHLLHESLGEREVLWAHVGNRDSRVGCERERAGSGIVATSLGHCSAGEDRRGGERSIHAFHSAQDRQQVCFSEWFLDDCCDTLQTLR